MTLCHVRCFCPAGVALRKESVDRNRNSQYSYFLYYGSLSARRAWIEILIPLVKFVCFVGSLSARRAWIEICFNSSLLTSNYVALRKESVDRNLVVRMVLISSTRRSPQGERG